MNPIYTIKNESIKIEKGITFKRLPTIIKKIAEANVKNISNKEYDFQILSENADPDIFQYLALNIAVGSLAISSNNELSNTLKSIQKNIGAEDKFNSSCVYDINGRRYHIHKVELNDPKEDADHYLDQIMEKYMEEFMEKNNISPGDKYQLKLLEYINNIAELLSNAFLHSRMKSAHIILSTYKDEFSFAVYDAGFTISGNAKEYFRKMDMNKLRSDSDYFKWALENNNSTKKLWNKKERGGNGLFRVEKYARDYNETFYLFSGGVLHSTNDNSTIELPKSIISPHTTFALITLKLNKEKNDN